MLEPRLAGKTILVTGGNSGIGTATVEAFAAQGAAMAVHFLREKEGERHDDPWGHTVAGAAAAEALVSRLREQGARAVAVEGDLSDPATIPSLFDHVEAALAPVDVLVNNAAHCERPDTILEMTAGVFDRHFAVNARGAVLLMAEFARRCRDRRAGGRIVNVSTDAAQTFATQIAYGASKAALEAFTRSVAIELGPLGITVNTVAPGPVQTGWITPELEEQVLPSIPLGRLGQPSDIADAIVFLASEQARWITGQVIKVSGGHAL